ncbi:hypothetical protein HPB50_010872 [Hyalomma asiaticum]|uniref:Uncharacterized protein n=1 Tax=Hyalomma asiaticum TaxID=266040 RepID=A0ACB7RP02_HYAAI|nr:hypothetical protein HPB50_010872 [Hyalomma asiaticum]
MSDGVENENPRLKDVLPKVTAAKVEVSTLALGTSADEQLEKLATATRGKAFFFEDLKGNTALRMETAFVEATTTQAGADKDYITLVDKSTGFETRLEQKLVLEPSLGNNTVIMVERVRPTHADITVTLIDPSGQECKKCADRGDERTKKIVIPSPAQSGEWTIRVDSNLGSQSVEVNIQAKSQGRDPNSEPIRVVCRMASIEVGKPDGAIIYADVNKGKKIVLDATVVAEVTGPNKPHKSTVPLRDNGQQPDIEADDGTYSGYFVQFTGKGRYAVTAHVSSDHRARLSDPKIASGSFYSTTLFTLTSGTPAPYAQADHEWSIDDFEDDNSTAEITNQTSTSAAASRCLPEGGGGWVLPASAVDIRASRDYAKLDSDFEKQEQITMADVIEGNLDPLPAGTKHVATFTFAIKWATSRPDGALDWKIFLAARVANSDGLKSNTSNIVQVTYASPPVTTTVVITTTTAATTTEMTTTEATTTPATTTPATTTKVTTAAVTTTQITSTTESATTTTTGVQGTQESRGQSKLWLWILIGGIAVVILISAVLAVLFRASTSKRGVYNFLVVRWRANQDVPASGDGSELL